MVGVTERTGQGLHVGVNAHLLSLTETYRSAGISFYIQKLLDNLPVVDPKIRYTAFVGQRQGSPWHSDAGPSGLRCRSSRLPTQRPMLRIWWEQAIQPWSNHQAGVDLSHGMAFVGPLLGACPFVITVHDLSFLRYPQSFRAPNRFYLRLFTRLSAQRAQRVIAVSESTKRDLVQQYGLSRNKVDVIHNGVDPSFHPLPAAQVTAFRAARGLPHQFLLFVGTLEPRKNVAGLVEAYARLAKPRPPLMLVGGKGWLYDEVFALVEARNLTDEVQFVGYVPAEELPAWYNAATVFVYPSFYEGFGLPPLEAMACGTPVVTSSASALPEVVGQAGLMVDPGDPDALTAAMERALTDLDLREQMQSAGIAQAAGFSWRKTALHTAACYWRAMGTEGTESGRGGEQHV